MGCRRKSNLPTASSRACRLQPFDDCLLLKKLPANLGVSQRNNNGRLSTVGFWVLHTQDQNFRHDIANLPRFKIQHAQDLAAFNFFIA